MNKIRILNSEVVAATQEELLRELRQVVVVTPNIDHLVKLRKDRQLYELYKQTEWLLFPKNLENCLDVVFR